MTRTGLLAIVLLGAVVLIVAALLVWTQMNRPTTPSATPGSFPTPPAGVIPTTPLPKRPPSRPGVFCPTIYDPVCGDDGKTYSNACVATEQLGVAVARRGSCDEQ